VLYILILLNFRAETGRQQIPKWMLASILSVHFALNFFLNAIFICYCRSSCLISKDLLIVNYDFVLHCDGETKPYT
jgi:thiosulfate reductase cytochrome b subunit